MKKSVKKILLGVLSAVAVAVFGFILLNLTFLFDFLFQSIIDFIIKPFTSSDINMVWNWFPPMKHFTFVIVIGIISWFIFKSKLKTIYKAIFMTVPVAVVLVTLGIFFYRWPVLLYLMGGLFSIGVLYYLYKNKKSWIYYYALILVSVVLAISTLMGVEI